MSQALAYYSPINTKCDKITIDQWLNASTEFKSIIFETNDYEKQFQKINSTISKLSNIKTLNENIIINAKQNILNHEFVLRKEQEMQKSFLEYQNFKNQSLNGNATNNTLNYFSVVDNFYIRLSDAFNIYRRAYFSIPGNAITKAEKIIKETKVQSVIENSNLDLLYKKISTLKATMPETILNLKNSDFNLASCDEKYKPLIDIFESSVVAYVKSFGALEEYRLKTAEYCNLAKKFNGTLAIARNNQLNLVFKNSQLLIAKQILKEAALQLASFDLKSVEFTCPPSTSELYKNYTNSFNNLQKALSETDKSTVNKECTISLENAKNANDKCNAQLSNLSSATKEFSLKQSEFLNSWEAIKKIL